MTGKSLKQNQIRCWKINYNTQQELFGQFSSTVEQELYHYESRNNDKKIELKIESKKQTK